MKLARRPTTLIFALATIVTTMVAAGPARAAEPRPWLCRDKPVFSSGGPMAYNASLHGSGQWMMIFMTFDPSGGHDGFTIFDSRDVTGSITGSLERGQWYAVGMYREGDRWVCAAQAQENRQFVSGIVRDLCYGASVDGCDVKLIVREAGHAAP